MRHLIVGCGAAGVSAAQAIRSRDKAASIVMLAKQRQLPYSLCSLPAVLAGQILPSKIVRFRKGYFDDLNVELVFTDRDHRIYYSQLAVRSILGGCV
ncbi:MAG: NAD(P)/FAD-dependent oxidoreductase [Candidatus Thermoplasmatota archaeon]|nr:NAD(P)/FAD-dependent oxidoreductase [Candidatus Thermoplasmatota archaeon]